jgi:hypothetical protein
MKQSNFASLPEEDYDSIEQTIRATKKGQWFLQAYLERNRSPETEQILRSLTRLHRAAFGGSATGQIQRDIANLINEAARVRRSLAAVTSDASRAVILSHLADYILAELLAINELLEQDALQGTSPDHGHAAILSAIYDALPCDNDSDPCPKLLHELNSLVGFSSRN